MPCGDPEQRYRRAMRTATTLLPVSQCVNADPHGPGELDLGKTDETAERDDIITGLEHSGDEALSHPYRDGPAEVLLGQFGYFGH